MTGVKMRFPHYEFRTIIVLFLFIFSICGLQGQATTQNLRDDDPPPITDYPYICGFEGDGPPDGWAHYGTPTNPWDITGTVNGVSPYSGDKMIYAPIDGTNAGLSMPELQLSYYEQDQGQDHYYYYKFSFWIYRYIMEQSPRYPSLEIILENNGLMEQCFTITLAPYSHPFSGGSPGWYQYSFIILPRYGNNLKFSIWKFSHFTSDGDHIYLDDVRIDKIEITDDDKPSEARSPNPSNESTRVRILPELSWIAATTGLALEYDLYFDRSNPPQDLVATFDPPEGLQRVSWSPDDVLDLDTVYYWRVVPKNPKHNNPSEYPVWNFRTKEILISSPRPHGETDVDPRYVEIAFAIEDGWSLTHRLSMSLVEGEDWENFVSDNYWFGGNYHLVNITDYLAEEAYDQTIYFKLETYKDGDYYSGNLDVPYFTTGICNFSTKQLKIYDIPYIEHFREGNALPDSWATDTDIDIPWNATTFFANNYEYGYGASCAFGEGTTSSLKSATINLGQTAQDYKFRFNYALTSMGDSSQGYMDSDDSFTVEIYSATAPDVPLFDRTWNANQYFNPDSGVVEITLNNYSGDVYIKFIASSTSVYDGQMSQIHLDNVEIFKIGGPLSAPILQNPVPHQPNFQYLVDTQFEWFPSAGNPDGYRLYLKRDNEDWEEIADTSSLQFKPFFPLAFDCEYQWKVKAYRGVATSQSEEITFSTEDSPPHSISHSNDFHRRADWYYGNYAISEGTGINGRNSGRLSVSNTQPEAFIRTCLLEYNNYTRYSFNFRLLQNMANPISYTLQEGDKIELMISYDKGKSFVDIGDPLVEWNKSPGNYVYQITRINRQSDEPDPPSDPDTQMFMIVVTSGSGNSFFLDLDMLRISPVYPNSIVVPNENTLDFGDCYVDDRRKQNVFLGINEGYLEIIDILIVEDNDPKDFDFSPHPPSLPLTLEYLYGGYEFWLEFNPKSAGEKHAVLIITDDGGNEYEIALEGNALARLVLDPLVNPVYLDFDGGEEELAGWDAGKFDGDGSDWKYMQKDPLAQINLLCYVEGNSPDQFLLSPQMSLEADQLYYFMFSYKNAVDGDAVNCTAVYVDSLDDPDMNESNTMNFTNIIDSSWEVARLGFKPQESGIYYFGIISWQSAGDGILYVDNIRIMPPGMDKARILGIAIDASCNLFPSPVWNPLKDTIHWPEAIIYYVDELSKFEGIFEWCLPEGTIPDPFFRLSIRAEESIPGLAEARIFHQLGYTPEHIMVDIGSRGFQLIANPGDGSWTDIYIDYPLAAANGQKECTFIFAGSEDFTLPVMLSSFTAAAIPQGKIKVSWTTQSETDMKGFYLLRAETDNLVNAMQVSPLIEAHNTTQTQNYSFIDAELEEAGEYCYWLKCEELDGVVSYHGPCSVILSDQDFPNTPDIPLITELGNPYPNPFNPHAFINYSLAKESQVNLEVYNIKGQKVAILVNEKMPAGRYQYIWDGKAHNGRPVSSGIYLVRMKAGDYVKTAKVVMSK